MRVCGAWFSTLCAILVLSTTGSVAFASNPFIRKDGMRRFGHVQVNGGAQVMKKEKSSDATVNSSTELLVESLSHSGVDEKRPLHVLFLSSDTGGGHRASAEALAKQFLIQYPGSTYELADLWTDHGVLPYRTLIPTYQHFSAHPRQWRVFFHLSNTKPSELWANFHSKLTCARKLKKRLQSHNPDVIVSVHPAMNHTPLRMTRKISKELGKHIPFFTVVTDLGSAHCMWFEKNVDKLYVASDRLYKLARRRGGTPEENIVMTGLPIRHGFAVEAENMGDRTTEAGKLYQKEVRKRLGLDPEKRMVLIMGGGEGVGSLSDIVNEMYAKLSQQGVDATICVVCGRNGKLKADLETRNWDKVVEASKVVKPKRWHLFNLFIHARRSRRIEAAIEKAEEHLEDPHPVGNVDVVGLGFITNMPEYMVAADILVSKAGPGTIAEAASVGLPIMLTSYLPGQEAGNVDVVLESGYGDYCENPAEIAQEIGIWLQDDALLKTMSHAAQKSGNPYAADEIVRDIGMQTVAWMNLNEK